VVGELIAGRYELEELVGTGGMSSVFRAHDRLLERRVALKILHEELSSDQDYIERFRREARAVARLSHPNIVTVIDRGEQDGRQFIVFEYVEGENLKALLERRGPLPVPEAVRIGCQVARGLAFAHERGLVHRDVKPQNVLLAPDGQAKVTDFGIARSGDAGLTQTGTVMGTSDYMAPEQARGEHVDAQSDVYSLGAVLYELLTGDVPFPGENFVAVAMRHINDPPPSARERRADVPPRLDETLRTAMAKEQSDRYEMAELAAELEAGLDGAAPADDGEDTMEFRLPHLKLPRGDRGRRLVLIGLFALALAIIAGAITALLVFNPSSSKKTAPPPRSPAPRIQLHGVNAYDPYGPDHSEHNELVADATDGRLDTSWHTERYRSFDKPGVGLVLDARKAIEPETIHVASDTPGFEAVIKAGSSRSGPFPQTVSPSQPVGNATDFRLDMKAPARYFLVWITNPAPNGVADVNEVRAR
jgi:serine/threonine-protein kinase